MAAFKFILSHSMCNLRREERRTMMAVIAERVSLIYHA